ncbi:MAG: putative toxin-antitoxin system toxin component, PIN family [Bacteroidia bacterium]
MQRIVIDTNIVVSSLLSQKGIPAKIINDLVLFEKVIICVSKEVLDEYEEVLSRDKFKAKIDFSVNAEILIDRIKQLSEKHNPQLMFDLISDKDDNMFLDLAFQCKADFIITGNTNDFTFSKFLKTKIVTPAIYWDNFKP